MRNRIADPAAEGTIAAMKGKLAALRRQYRDSDGPVVTDAQASPGAVERGRRHPQAAAGMHRH